MDLQSIEREALDALEQTNSLPEVDALYTRFLGRKEGQLTSILRNLATLSPDEKKRVGQEANRLRALLEEKFSSKQKALQSTSLSATLEKEKVDVTLPGHPFKRGHSHPVIRAIEEISEIFRRIGFEVAEGPDIETDLHNFTALNIPPDHPARDLHDTFYLSSKPLLLRTHTSPVQIRLMKAAKPPIRMIAPGRVYRHEAVDATHAAIFHQIEGLAVDEKISFADLKGTLSYFAKQYFGKHTEVRFRPSYFPFVEPGAEMDLTCFFCGGKGRSANGESCSVCKGAGWIEMLGAGMVHPHVLRNVGYDAEKYTGFAFGMGIERIVMTKFQIQDIRLFLESDLRFLEQF